MVEDDRKVKVKVVVESGDGMGLTSILLDMVLMVQ